MFTTEEKKERIHVCLFFLQAKPYVCWKETKYKEEKKRFENLLLFVKGKER
jgi:hypothetical protein